MVNVFQQKIAQSTDKTINNPVLNDKLKDIAANQDPVNFFNLIIPKTIGLAFVIGVLVFFFVLVIGAIQWTGSGGDKTALESARGKIGNALVGIIILFSLFAFLKFIEGFFGINILTLDIGPLRI